jgi:hypothetical protein
MGILILTINRIADTQDQDVGRNFAIVPYLRHLDVAGRHRLPMCVSRLELAEVHYENRQT